ANHGDVFGAAFGQPHFAGTPEDLAHVGAVAGHAVTLEFLGARIEAVDGVAAPFAHPRHVALIDVDGINLGTGTRQLPLPPGPALWIVHRQVAAVPLADPQSPFAVAPNPARTLVLRWRLDDLRVAR